jgi:glycerol-3-phosphate dehydrogenase
MKVLDSVVSRHNPKVEIAYRLSSYDGVTPVCKVHDLDKNGKVVRGWEIHLEEAKQMIELFIKNGHTL